MTASALASLIESCVMSSSANSSSEKNLRNWRNLLIFASRTLAIPSGDGALSSGTGLRKVSLTSVITKQVTSFLSDDACALQPRKLSSYEGVRSSVPQAQGFLQSSNQRLKKRVEVKLVDGNVAGAVRFLSSDFSLAPSNIDMMEALRYKHTPAPSDVRLPPPPSTSVAHMTVTPEGILKGIRSFGPSSAAGPDQLNPQHLKELTTRQNGEAGSRLVTALASLANLLLSGGIPCAVQPLLYGANLLALRKPDGGVRPIAVGNTLHRLVAKVINMQLCAVVGDHLRPIQLGYGTPGGCEAAIHAARTFLANSSLLSPRVLLKIDYKNAFNSIRRDTFLGMVRAQFPEVYPFVWQCYNSPSTLFFGDFMLKSATGVQ